MSRNWINGVMTDNISSQLNWTMGGFVYIPVEKDAECVVVNNDRVIRESGWLNLIGKGATASIIRYVNLGPIEHDFTLDEVETQDTDNATTLQVHFDVRVKDPRLVITYPDPLKLLQKYAVSYLCKQVRLMRLAKVDEDALAQGMRSSVLRERLCEDALTLDGVIVTHQDVQAGIRKQVRGIEGRTLVDEAEQERILARQKREYQWEAFKRREAEVFRHFQGIYDLEDFGKREAIARLSARIKILPTIIQTLETSDAKTREERMKLFGLLTDTVKSTGGLPSELMMAIKGAVAGGTFSVTSIAEQQHLLNDASNSELWQGSTLEAPTQNYRFCPNCPSLNRPNANFCRNCGHEL